MKMTIRVVEIPNDTPLGGMEVELTGRAPKQNTDKDGKAAFDVQEYDPYDLKVRDLQQPSLLGPEYGTVPSQYWHQDYVNTLPPDQRERQPQIRRYKLSGDYSKQFADKLLQGQRLAVKMADCVISLLENTSIQDLSQMKVTDGGTVSPLKSWFGAQAEDPAQVKRILQRFRDLRKALFQSYEYMSKPRLQEQAVTDDSGSHDIDLGINNIHYEAGRYGKRPDMNYTFAGMAALILHENVHRLGFRGTMKMGEDETHVDERGPGTFRRQLETSGESIDFGAYDWFQTDRLLINCDSFAGFATWAWKNAGKPSPFEWPLAP